MGSKKLRKERPGSKNNRKLSDIQGSQAGLLGGQRTLRHSLKPEVTPRPQNELTLPGCSGPSGLSTEPLQGSLVCHCCFVLQNNTQIHS